MSVIRKPAVAGLFYPNSSSKLKSEIELLLSISKPDIKPKDLFGIIVPHAGYVYSGRTAAYAYNLIKDKNIKTVIVISPSHREYFPGSCVYNGDAYSTPLGTIPINKEIANKISENSKTIMLGTLGHKDEHAIEIQLPFLQTLIKDFSLVPIVMGDQSKIFINELSERLSSVIDESTIIIASSDLSHYHNKTDANYLDSVVENSINNFNFNQLESDLENRECEACGGGPIVTLMQTAAKMNKHHAVVLDRRDSGDTSGDNNEVVGYLSAAIYGE